MDECESVCGSLCVFVDRWPKKGSYLRYFCYIVIYSITTTQ